MSYGIAYKIPILDGTSNAGSYRGIPIDLNDPRASEPLVRFPDFGIAGESFYARKDGNNAPYYERIEGATEHIWGRKTVAEKLAHVNALLRPMEIELFVWDAYRPIKCQEGLWSFFSKQAAKKFPDATEEERINYILNFVSDPSRFSRPDPTSWPVHACGGAVDLTLRAIKTGALLDMGAGFDEMDEISYSDVFERKARAGEIGENDPRLENRRLLHWAMAQEGFINYRLEFWHFDFGDQMYVLHSKLLDLPEVPQKAWYGYVDSPEPVSE